MNNVISAISDTAREFRSVLRGLGHKPGYAIAAWVMLGLAIAANAAVFAIVYGFLLKPMPYPQPQQISMVRERLPKIGLNTPLVSVKTYLALKQDLKGTVTAGLATNPNEDIATIDGRPHLLMFQNVTPSLFSTFGVAPVLGRVLGTDTGQPGGPPEAVITWQLWQSAYGGRSNVLNQSFEIEGKTYRIVGVMPRGFFFVTPSIHAWLPYVMTPERTQNDNINYWMAVRRNAGASPDQLDLELKNYTQRMLAQKTPKERASYIQDGYTIDAEPPRAIALNYFGIGHLPWLLQAAAGLLLLLALANTINLGLVRQRMRQQQFAVREVLGASRTGLVRLILLEHLPIAMAIGVSATLLAWAGIGALHANGLPPQVSPFKIELAPPVIIFTWVVTVVAVLIVAFGQALLATGRHLLESIRDGRTIVGGRGARRLQRSLGVIQIALACALVIAGGLLGVSLLRVLSQPLGFTPDNRYVITVIVPGSKSNSALWTSLKPELQKLPGVQSAAVTGMVPFAGGYNQGGISKAGASHNLIVDMPTVSTDYFSTIGIGFVAGHPFTQEEMNSHAPVIVINEALAKHFFVSADQAIGQNLEFNVDGYHNPRIVGVARDIAWAPTPDQYRFGTAYLPFWVFQQGFNVVVQARGAQAPLIRALNRTVQAALPDSVVFQVASLSNVVRGASVFRAAGVGMVGAFAALALLLAALGAFAITAFIARARLGEYGIRSALGAGPLALLRLGFREAAWLLIIGIPIGLVGAWVLGRAVASTLYQTPVLEWWLYVVGALLIIAVVLAAAWGPARRAARVPVRELLSGDTQ